MKPVPENDSDDSALPFRANGDAGNGHDQALDVGSLIRAALLQGADRLSSGNHDEPAYDGRVSLALDAEILPAIDATLDLLTTSTDLFDVPAFDFGRSAGDCGDL